MAASHRRWTLFGMTLLCVWPALAACAQGDPGPAAPRHASMEAEMASIFRAMDFPALWTRNSGAAWAAFCVALSIGLVAGWVCSAVFRRVGERFEKRRWPAFAKLLLDSIGPLRLTLLTVALAVGLAGLEMSDVLRDLLARKTVKLLYCTAAFWYLYSIVGLIDLGFQRLLFKRESFIDRQLAPLMRKSLRCLMAVVAVLFVFDSVLEQDIRAWLAGLGIVGLGVSLAAQDSIKNLFGSITILFDRPFQLGDRIIFAGYDGTIEDIGFRSTKIRTTAGHLISIPNSKIVNDSVENISRRAYIRRAFNVTLPGNTSAAALARAIAAVREVLAEPEIAASLQAWEDGQQLTPRVHLSDMPDDKQRISVTYWYAPPVHAEYLEHAQTVNLRILGRLEEEGVAGACEAASTPASASTKPVAPAPSDDA